jgi:butyrate kinase
MDNLIFKQAPIVTFGSNHYVNVPTILQYDDTPLVEIIRESPLEITTGISIYHPDGTYLAKARGARLFLTKDGEKCNLVLKHLAGATVCELGGKTLFEVKRTGAAAISTKAELYTPTGYFVSVLDSKPRVLTELSKDITRIGGLTTIGNTFNGCRIGVWVKSDGSILVGVS